MLRTGMNLIGCKNLLNTQPKHVSFGFEADMQAIEPARMPEVFPPVEADVFIQQEKTAEQRTPPGIIQQNGQEQTDAFVSGSMLNPFEESGKATASIPPDAMSGQKQVPPEFEVPFFHCLDNPRCNYLDVERNTLDQIWGERPYVFTQHSTEPRHWNPLSRGDHTVYDRGQIYDLLNQDYRLRPLLSDFYPDPPHLPRNRF